MVLDYSVMTNVIATPQHNIVADGGEWLNGVVFEYETVVANRRPREDGCFGADVANHFIALLLDLVINRFTQLIHPAGRQGREKLKVRGRIRFCHALKRDNRQALEG